MPRPSRSPSVSRTIPGPCVPPWTSSALPIPICCGGRVGSGSGGPRGAGGPGGGWAKPGAGGGRAPPAGGGPPGDLVDIALAGCEHLGPGYFHPADLELARHFFDQFTRRGRAPADEVEGAEIAA